MAKYLGTKEAAKELGVTSGRVRQLILGGRIKATKFGRDWIITREELERHKKERSEGNRP